jgi:hypothetical protein
MQAEQRGLFETKTLEGYPLAMDGNWNGFKACAVVDTPEQRDKLLEQGYTICDTEPIATNKR